MWDFSLNEGLQSVTTETMLWDGKTFGLHIPGEKLTPDISGLSR